MRSSSSAPQLESQEGATFKKLQCPPEPGLAPEEFFERASSPATDKCFRGQAPTVHPMKSHGTKGALATLLDDWSGSCELRFQDTACWKSSQGKAASNFSNLAYTSEPNSFPTTAGSKLSRAITAALRALRETDPRSSWPNIFTGASPAPRRVLIAASGSLRTSWLKV